MSPSSILIVDDNAGDRHIATYHLSRVAPAVTVLTAENGEEAMALLSGTQMNPLTADPPLPPRLILLDLNMPGMDGFAFLERYQQLSADHRQTTVIVLTSSDDESDRARAGAFDEVAGFLTKPLTRAQAQAVAAKYGLVG